MAGDPKAASDAVAAALQDANAQGLNAAEKDTIARQVAKSYGYNNPEHLTRALHEQGRGDWSDAFLQGLSFGFSDEIGAFAESITGDKTYADAVEERRGDLEAYRRRNPWLALALEAGGSMANPVAWLPFAGAARAATLTGRLATVAAGGALEGAIAGMGAGEGDIVDRLPGAAVGGLVGGVAAPAASAIAVPIRKGAAALTNAARGGRTARVMADATVREAVESEMPLQRAAARLGGLQAGGKPAVIADIAEGTQDLAQSVSGMRGPGRARVQSTLRARGEGAPARIRGDIERIFGDDEATFRTAIRDLRDFRSAAARRNYPEIYAQQPDMTDTLRSLLKRPTVANAWRGAQRAAADEGVDLPEAFVPDDAGNLTLATETVPDMNAWDFIKRGLDDIIEDNTDAVTGKVNAAGRRAVNLKTELLGELDAQVPDYATARRMYADPSQVIESMDLGRDMWTANAKKLDRMLFDIEDMSPMQREGFLRGVVRGMHDTMDTAVGGADRTRRLLKNDTQRKLLRAAMPEGDEGDEMFNDFVQRLDAESTMRQTENRLQGSRTAPMLEGIDRLKERAAATADEGISPRVFVDPISEARRLSSADAANVARIREEQLADALSRALMSGDQATLNRIMRPPTPLRRAEEAIFRNAPVAPSVAFPAGAAGYLGGLFGNQ